MEADVLRQRLSFLYAPENQAEEVFQRVAALHGGVGVGAAALGRLKDKRAGTSANTFCPKEPVSYSAGLS